MGDATSQSGGAIIPLQAGCVIPESGGILPNQQVGSAWTRGLHVVLSRRGPGLFGDQLEIRPGRNLTVWRLPDIGLRCDCAFMDPPTVDCEHHKPSVDFSKTGAAKNKKRRRVPLLGGVMRGQQKTSYRLGEASSRTMWAGIGARTNRVRFRVVRNKDGIAAIVCVSTETVSRCERGVGIDQDAVESNCGGV